MDFGFSKDYRETLNIWDRKQVVSDIVRVIRTFRPDVVITRFSPQPGNTHGHHTASAVLAVEAFKLAGDPKAFPEQLDGADALAAQTHLAERPAVRSGRPECACGWRSGGNDPVTGESFGAIWPAQPRHAQDAGLRQFRGGGGGGGARRESFKLLAGEPGDQGHLDGVDTTWGRVPGRRGDRQTRR